jgi:hypothetical protein
MGLPPLELDRRIEYKRLFLEAPASLGTTQGGDRGVQDSGALDSQLRAHNLPIGAAPIPLSRETSFELTRREHSLVRRQTEPETWSVRLSMGANLESSG